MDGVSCQPFIEFGSPLESSLRWAAAVAAAVVVVALMSWAKGAQCRSPAWPASV